MSFTYKPEELLPGLIDDTDSGKQLLEWYVFLSNIEYRRRNIIYCDDMITFYRCNFNLDISKLIDELSENNDLPYIKGYIKGLYLHLLMCDKSIICDDESLKKLLLYDYNFLVRISSMMDIIIIGLLYNIVLSKEEYNFNAVKLNYINPPQITEEDIRWGDTRLRYGYEIVNEDYDKEKAFSVSQLTYLAKNPNIDISSYTNVRLLSIKDNLINKTLPIYLTHLILYNVNINDDYVYPETLISMHIHKINTSITFPESLLSLEIDEIRNNTRLILPSKLKSLTAIDVSDFTSKDDGYPLPISLERLDMEEIDEEIKYLVNLKVLFVRSVITYTIPANIEYLYMYNLNINLNSLKKLKYLECHSTDRNIPSNVIYLSINSNYKKVPDSVKYLITDAIVNIPSNVVYFQGSTYPSGRYDQLKIYNAGDISKDVFIYVWGKLRGSRRKTFGKLWGLGK